MAAYNKIQDFVNQLTLKNHNLNTETFRLALTNGAPVATNTAKANLTEISGANGYTTGGIDTQNTCSTTTGTATMQGSQCQWTGGPSAMDTFRYPFLYNDDSTSPADSLVAWWDYGVGGVTLQNGETFTARFSGASPGTILTLS